MTYSPDAVERVFEQFMPLHQHATTPLSKFESEALLVLTVADDNIINDMLKDLFDKFEWKLVDGRSRTYPIMIGNRVKIFLTALARTPGEVSLYLALFQYLAFKKNKTFYTLEDFCEDFGSGVFSKEDLSRMWGLQKAPSGLNMVDSSEAQLSFIVKSQEPQNA